MFTNVWLCYELTDQRNHGLLPNRPKRFFLFCTMSRWSRNYQTSYTMCTRGKVAGVWTRAFTSICSQDDECIQLHCHHYPYIFVTACQWFYHWLAISPYSFLYGQVYFLLPNLLGQTQKNVDHLGILHYQEWWSYKSFGGMYCLSSQSSSARSSDC